MYVIGLLYTACPYLREAKPPSITIQVITHCDEVFFIYKIQLYYMYAIDLLFMMCVLEIYKSTGYFHSSINCYTFLFIFGML